MSNWEENEILRQNFIDVTKNKLWAEKDDGDCGFSEDYVFWLEEIVLKQLQSNQPTNANRHKI